MRESKSDKSQKQEKNGYRNITKRQVHWVQLLCGVCPRVFPNVQERWQVCPPKIGGQKGIPYHKNAPPRSLRTLRQSSKSLSREDYNGEGGVNPKHLYNAKIRIKKNLP